MNVPVTLEQWATRAAGLALDGRPFHDGQRVQPLATETFAVSHARSGGTLATLADCGHADVDRAVANARMAFESGSWSGLAASERAAVLRKFAGLIGQHAEELGLLDTLQMGMPISASVPGMAMAVEIVNEVADLADKNTDQLFPSASTALAMNVRRPYGVVAAITPWNFPTHVALQKVVPALAMGNSVLLKPSENAPLACLRLADLAFEAGVPAGVFNALPGLGASTGKALALHRDVDCMAFTGSTATGLMLMQYAGQSNMKSLRLECGGKSPQVVFDDVGDIESLADSLVQGFTWNSGQVCVTGSRILVADALYERLTGLLAERVSALATGDPLDPSTMLGPLVNTQQHARVSGMIAASLPTERLLASGDARHGGANAVAPHLYAASDNGSPLVQEEVFGPVAAVMRFSDEAQALALANGTRYGLSGTIWTSSFAQGHRFARNLRAGFITVQHVAHPAPPMVRYLGAEPAGLSGFGADGGLPGLLAYTRLSGVTHLLG
ncbi:MAG: aldehyde dehydrogenase family protein [Chitinophagaceae bacterium]|nr:aldehyde dehydrogenase family protein [Rubrivivax sp.]